MALAIVAAVASAFTTKPAFVCDFQVQYYWNGAGYEEAGVFGMDYDCDWNQIEACTYYRPNPLQPNNYVACKPGSFFFLGARKASIKK